MKIHHLRNATFVIETGDKIILVDPMLGDKGTQPPFTLFRFKARKNPIVPLPDNCQPILEKVTHCLVTNKHPDHIDKDAEKFLIKRNIPVICSEKDAKHFRNKGLNVTQSVKYWEKESFLGGSITGIPARHGYGFIASPMGDVMGYFIELPDTSSIYISADTIYTDDVNRVLTELKPDISVVASGQAQLDFGQPLMMKLNDVIRFIENAPHKVIANHQEAVNHCPITRKGLKERLLKEGLEQKVHIPNDGEIIEMI